MNTRYDGVEYNRWWILIECCLKSDTNATQVFQDLQNKRFYRYRLWLNGEPFPMLLRATPEGLPKDRNALVLITV